MEIRRLSSPEELFAVAAGDHIVRTDVAPESGIRGWVATGGPFAFCADLRDGQRGWLSVIGEPGTGAEELLRTALADLPVLPWGVSVPRGTDLSGFDLHDHEEWDYMVFEGAGPPAAQPGQERVAVLPDTAESFAEIEETLKIANPTASTRPGAPGRLWAGVRDDAGLLLAVGSYTVRDGGNGYLSAIGTRPEARGQGLGAALTAWLTTRSVADGNPFCSLGHWWPNEPARRVYLRLGYRTTHAMSSGHFPEDGAGEHGPESACEA